MGHLWELGGGPFLTNLLEIPISLEYLPQLSLLLVLDLSKPEELWHVAESLLATSKVLSKTSFTSLSFILALFANFVAS